MIIVIIIILLVILIGIIQRIRRINELKKTLKYNYGKFNKNHIDETKLNKISRYYYDKKIVKKIDDITFNDLNMKEVFEAMDNSISSVGSEYLFAEIRNLDADDKKLKFRDSLAEYYNINEEKRIETQIDLLRIGKFKRESVYDNILNINNFVVTSNLFEFLLIGIFIGTICMSIYKEEYSIFFIMSLVLNVIFYYYKRANIKSHLITFKLILNMLTSINKIYNKNSNELKIFEKDIKKIKEDLLGLNFASRLINENNGDLLSMLLDYIYMVIHIDIIVSNYIVKILIKNMNSIIRLYEIIGEIELAINIASFRERINEYSKPEFIDDLILNIDNIYHPLIDKPIKNSINTTKSILLTGSNASGKSTFLKTIALNAILAQTIYTTASDKYIASKFNIMSSMAIRDNLFNNESYYIVEIKSLKRILDSDKSIPVLCFIDEILRGTNTIERISASKVILEKLTKMNCLCIAATHDIELTTMLNDCYDNYHFEEQISGKDIMFDYKLKKGPSNTRNAIKLLEIIGFEDDIIHKANNEVDILEKDASI